MISRESVLQSAKLLHYLAVSLFPQILETAVSACWDSVPNPLNSPSSSKSPLASVSACGENYVRSLAPPLPTQPASLGLHGGGPGWRRVHITNTVLPCKVKTGGSCTHERSANVYLCGEFALYTIHLNIAFAGFTAPKLLWMRKHEPELFARIDKVMLPKDYINYMLTGVHCTDVSDASGMLLFDVEHKRWSPEMLELCGLRECQMAKIFESYEVVGTLKPEMAKALGLSECVKVCAGAGDNAAAAVGTATVGDGRCNISLGTSGTIFISSKTFGVDPNNALHAFAHADGHYHLMGCMLSAASCNKWWMEEVLKTGEFATEQAPITGERLGKNHVFFLPYLMGNAPPLTTPTPEGPLLA